MRTYGTLEPEAIVATIESLSRRIDERFPGSGLSAVSRELLGVSGEVQQRAADLTRPQVGLRLGVGVLIGALVLALVVAPFAASMPRSFALPELVQVTEASINLLVLIGGAVFFLVTAERRIRRGRVLSAIHELRAFAHVIDMHQLAKDPQRLLQSTFLATSSSPTEPLTPFELSRYLEYCSEMFSLTGKLAAVYIADIDDPALVAAANELEALTTGLSRKVWQKIMILHSGLGSGPPA